VPYFNAREEEKTFGAVGFVADTNTIPPAQPLSSPLTPKADRLDVIRTAKMKLLPGNWLSGWIVTGTRRAYT